MNEFLRKRIERKLASLPEERVYQVLDYIEFLESRYATRAADEPTPFQKLAETVEDTLRAGRASASVVKGTMDAMTAAGNLMGGIVAAGKAVVDEVAGGNAPGQRAGAAPKTPPATETKDAAPPPPASPPPATSPPDGATPPPEKPRAGSA